MVGFFKLTAPQGEIKAHREVCSANNANIQVESLPVFTI